MSWRDWARARAASTRADGRWRSIRDFDARGPRGRLDGREVVSFASNDYLGLSAHPLVEKAAHDALARWGSGSGSARLIVGSRPVHGALERELADWKNTESALLFPTGFAANLGVLSTFGTDDALIFSDELNHASIVDGCRLAKAEVAVYPHNDIDALETVLAASSRRNVIVSDLVFSMDGDRARVDELLDLAGRYDALLILDEAHSVLGAEIDTRGAEVLRVGTLSKFLGSSGGFVAGNTEMIELLVNTARSFIFTTASSPADAAAALAAVELVRSAEGDALKARLRHLIDLVRPGHTSPIIPIVVGDEATATAAASQLLDEGLFVPAIRPPSVPQGTSRLRVTLSAAHSEEDVQRLVDALRKLEPAFAHA